MTAGELEALLAGDVFSIARGLLGWSLVSDIGDETTGVTIVETEAYAGGDDPASHAFLGQTHRQGAMFGQAVT